MRLVLGLLYVAPLAWAVDCRQPLTLRARHVSPDAQLIFEQRVASSDPASGSSWQSWRLYESGRLIYSRAGTAATFRRLAPERLAAVRRWLQAHDYELVRSTAATPAPSGTDIAATCQLQLSTGLALAPFGDRRYYACDELKRLAGSE
jgi:hypothetical protein